MAQLDPSIILAGRPFDFGASFGQGLQIGQGMQQGQQQQRLGDLQIRQAEQGLAAGDTQMKRQREYDVARKALALIDKAQTPEMWDMIAQRVAPELLGQFDKRDTIRAVMEATASALDPSTPDEPKTMNAADGSIIQLIPDGQGSFTVKTLAPGRGESAPNGYRYGDDGSLHFIPGGPADPKTRDALRGPGTTLTLPDGTVVDLFGGATGQIGKAGMNEVDKDLIDAAGLLTGLVQIEESFDPKFLELETRAGVAWANLKDKLGSASPEEQAAISEFSVFRRRTLTTLTERLNALSGAAITPQEFDRISRTLPNAGTGIFDGDGPTEFKAKMDDATRTMRLAVMRLTIWQAEGRVGGPEEIAKFASLDDMEGIVLKRHKMLEDAVRANGLTDQNEIDAMVANQIRQELGL